MRHAVQRSVQKFTTNRQRLVQQGHIESKAYSIPTSPSHILHSLSYSTCRAASSQQVEVSGVWGRLAPGELEADKNVDIRLGTAWVARDLAFGLNVLNDRRTRDAVRVGHVSGTGLCDQVHHKSVVRPRPEPARTIHQLINQLINQSINQSITRSIIYLTHTMHFDPTLLVRVTKYPTTP